MPHLPSADEPWMNRALELARRGEGLTRPNPAVGAVLVKNGRLIAEGFHRKAGGPHAEIVALRNAGPRARGATLYVTLEPCSTWGRTPPCTEAIVQHGIRRVVVGVQDPNPRHAGRGLKWLRRRGVDVTLGVCKEACVALIEPFAMLQTKGRPFVTLKLGSTLDGRIGDSRGRSRWITGGESRREVHTLRRRVDAILVGRQTATKDNPSLIPTPSHGRRPWRVLLDQEGRIPVRSRLFTDGRGRQTIVFTTTRSSAAYRAALAERGVDVEVIPAPRGAFSIKRVLRSLGRRGVMHVLCEGGGVLADALLRHHLVDEAWFFFAPRILGADAIPSIGGKKGWQLANAPQLSITHVQQLGEDVLIRARRRE